MADALSSPDPWMRLAGARQVAETPRGIEVLIALAHDGGLAGRLRTQALEALPTAQAANAEDHTVTSALLDLLPKASGSLLVATLEALRRSGTLAPLDALVTRARAVGGDAKVAIVTSATEHGPLAVPLLVGLLGDRDNYRVPLAAAQALSMCGDVSAVEALLGYSTSVFAYWEFKGAARSAIEAIDGDGKPDGAEYGAFPLSLAEPPDGDDDGLIDAADSSIADPDNDCIASEQDRNNEVADRSAEHVVAHCGIALTGVCGGHEPGRPGVRPGRQPASRTGRVLGHRS